MLRWKRIEAVPLGVLLFLAGLAAAIRPGAEGIGEGGGGRVPASGKEVTREFDQRGFERVRVSHAFEARLSQGDRFQVTVRLDEAFLPYLEVRQSGGSLSVGFRPGFQGDGRAARPRVVIRLPRLRGLELSGAVQATLEGFRSDLPLELELSGASGLRGRIEAGDVRLRVSGASRVQLTGSARDTRLELSGASEADLLDFPVRDAVADVSGASTARVHPRGRLEVEASGASRVLYGGSPAMGRVELSGASSISEQ